MRRHKKAIEQRITSASLSMLVVVIISAAFFTHTHPRPFISSEVAFSDASHSGLSIVPASCPSVPPDNPAIVGNIGYREDYAGQCNNPPVVHVSICGIMSTPATIGPGASATLIWRAPDLGVPSNTLTFANTTIANYGVVSPDGQATVTLSNTTKYVYTGQVHYSGWAPGVYQSFVCDDTITVDPSLCGAALSPTAAGNGYVLAPGTSRKSINRFSISVCVSNSSGNNYFIPANTQGELQSFLNAASGLSGVTVQ